MGCWCIIVNVMGNTIFRKSCVHTFRYKYVWTVKSDVRLVDLIHLCHTKYQQKINISRHIGWFWCSFNLKRFLVHRSSKLSEFIWYNGNSHLGDEDVRLSVSSHICSVTITKDINLIYSPHGQIIVGFPEHLSMSKVACSSCNECWQG